MKHAYPLLGVMLFAGSMAVQAGAAPGNLPTPNTPAPPPLHAPTAQPKAANPANNPATLGKEILKLGAVITGCEMDDKCIMTMLTELSKTDPNLAYKEYIKRAEQQRDLIERNIATCNTDAIRAFKKETSQCLAAGFEVMNKSSSLGADLNQKLEGQMEECLNIKMQTLATEGNIYAQLTVAQRALERDDMKAYQYWYAMAKGQAKSPEMAVVQPCTEGLDFSLKNFIETAKALMPLAK